MLASSSSSSSPPSFSLVLRLAFPPLLFSVCGSARVPWVARRPESKRAGHRGDGKASKERSSLSGGGLYPFTPLLSGVQSTYVSKVCLFLCCLLSCVAFCMQVASFVPRCSLRMSDPHSLSPSVLLDVETPQNGGVYKHGALSLSLSLSLSLLHIHTHTDTLSLSHWFACSLTHSAHSSLEIEEARQSREAGSGYK